MFKKRSLKIRAKISKTLTGKFASGQHPNYNPEIHILETRICSCPDHESFECEVRSNQKYIKGHHMKGKSHPPNKSTWKKGNIPWNKSLKQETDERVKKNAKSCSKIKLALYKLGLLVSGFKNKHHTKETKTTLAKAMTGRYVGEKSPHWQGGISLLPYSIEWTPPFKETIRIRDNYTCQKCSATQKDKTFIVHHIDYNKLNCTPKNLTTLCRSCNSKVNFNREYWTEYFSNKIEQIFKY
jgi:hypothetical protein